MIKCHTCDEKLIKDEIALNKKLLGRQIKQFLCLNCLAKYLETEPSLLEEKIQQFKDSGCTLFL